MAIEDWMPTVATKFGAVTGMTQVHTYDSLPATLKAFPCLVLLPTRGSASYPMIVHGLQMTLYTTAQVLPEALGVAVPFIERIRRVVITSSQLGGLVQAWYLAPDWYEGPGGIAYGDKMHTGIIFRSFIKEQETVNATP